MSKRRHFPDEFRAAVGLKMLRGDKTVKEIAAKRKLHPTLVRKWKWQAIEGITGMFSDKVKTANITNGEIKDLHAMVGLLWRMIFCHKGWSDEPVRTPWDDPQR